MSAAATTRRASFAFILVTVTLDVLAIGLIIPVLPGLVKQFTGGDTSRAAMWFGLMSATWALMQFVFSPILGALSDRYGRRPVLLGSNFGLGLDYILMALAPTLGWLFAGRIASGIAAATFSTATAYIADVTPKEERAAAFGKIGAAFGVGFVLGPAVGGVIGAIDPRAPFWLAAALSLANAFYGYFILPESLASRNRAPFRLRTANPIGAVQLLLRDKTVTGLAFVLLLYHLAHAALPAVFVLFAGYRFGFGPREVGLVLAIVGISSAIVQAGLIRPAVTRFGARTTVLIGLAAGVFGFLVQGVVTSPLLYVIGIPIFTLWGFITPAAQQMISARLGSDEQGQLQGALSSLMSVANLVGPLLFSQVFAWAVASDHGAALAGAPFLLAAGLLAAAAIVVLRNVPDPRLESAP
jgi:DHA1 family tetracycline resistance protein-like MFS transporter